MILPLSIPSKQSHKSKILHITDTHLFASNTKHLLGIHSNISFRSVIDAIKQQQHHYDLIVATGDFVQDSSQQAYQYFASHIKTLNVPCVWLVGNHDDYSKMQTVFNEQHLPENKLILLGKNWVVILLNSQVIGQAYGYLPKTELTFLQTSLHNFQNCNALIFLHHHPILSGCHWLDAHSLKNNEDLAKIINVYPNIKGIGWGHIHQAQTLTWQDCYAFATPSTCVQFQPNSYDFNVSMDDRAGWREIELFNNGTIDTEVYRIDDVFAPNIRATGY